MSLIPRKEIHDTAINRSERGFPTRGIPQPDKAAAYRAPNNPVTKTPAEVNPQLEEERLDEGNLLGGTRVNQSGREENPREGRDPAGTDDIKKDLSESEWEIQEAQMGQGAKPAPAGG